MYFLNRRHISPCICTGRGGGIPANFPDCFWKYPPNFSGAKFVLLKVFGAFGFSLFLMYIPIGPRNFFFLAWNLSTPWHAQKYYTLAIPQWYVSDWLIFFLKVTDWFYEWKWTPGQYAIVWFPFKNLEDRGCLFQVWLSNSSLRVEVTGKKLNETKI